MTEKTIAKNNVKETKTENEKNKLEIIDGKGYKPDVWCESKNALDCTYSFLKKQGYNIK